jgi:ribosome biogenesis protein Nip4
MAQILSISRFKTCGYICIWVNKENAVVEVFGHDLKALVFKAICKICVNKIKKASEQPIGHPNAFKNLEKF